MVIVFFYRELPTVRDMFETVMQKFMSKEVRNCWRAASLLLYFLLGWYYLSPMCGGSKGAWTSSGWLWISPCHRTKRMSQSAVFFTLGHHPDKSSPIVWIWATQASEKSLLRVAVWQCFFAFLWAEDDQDPDLLRSWATAPFLCPLRNRRCGGQLTKHQNSCCEVWFSEI